MAQERKKNRQRRTEAQRLAHRDAVIEHSDNKFVAELTKKIWMHSSIQRTSIVALYKQLFESGMTSIEAYESLGFDTKKLERTVLSLRPSAQDRKRRTGSLNQRLRTMMEASLLRRCLK